MKRSVDAQGDGGGSRIARPILHDAAAQRGEVKLAINGLEHGRDEGRS
jgi:hypothetical protein